MASRETCFVLFPVVYCTRNAHSVYNLFHFPPIQSQPLSTSYPVIRNISLPYLALLTAGSTCLTAGRTQKSSHAVFYLSFSPHLLAHPRHSGPPSVARALLEEYNYSLVAPRTAPRPVDVQLQQFSHKKMLHSRFLHTVFLDGTLPSLYLSKI